MAVAMEDFTISAINIYTRVVLQQFPGHDGFKLRKADAGWRFQIALIPHQLYTRDELNFTFNVPLLFIIFLYKIIL